MRGISESRLRQIANQTHDSDDTNHVVLSLLDYLLSECKELQEPWIPIDKNTPRDRQIKIYDAGYGQVVVQWNAYFRCFTDPHGHKYLNPTHYQELPAGPVMPIHKPEPPR